MTTFDLGAHVFVMWHLNSKSSHGFEDDTLIKCITYGLSVNLSSVNLQWERNEC